MIVYSKEDLRKAAKLRQGNYYKACLQAGKQIGDKIHFERAALDEVRRRHPHHGHTPFRKSPRWFKPGNWLHAVALPIAKFFRMRCIDPRTGKLRPTSPCERRRRGMNTWGDKVYFWIEDRFFKTLRFLKRL